MDSRLEALKPQLLTWLSQVMDFFKTDPGIVLVQKGFEQAGLNRAFEEPFQREAYQRRREIFTLWEDSDHPSRSENFSPSSSSSSLSSSSSSSPFFSLSSSFSSSAASTSSSVFSDAPLSSSSSFSLSSSSDAVASSSSAEFVSS